MQTHYRSFPAPRRIALNDVTLEVFEAGQENIGNPIVLCHGWPEHAYSWRYQIPALVAAGYHVIAPNQRGYGKSTCPDDVSAYDITQLTGDLAALLDHYGYTDATFVGHDWGANIVWGLALLQPSRVRKIINLALPYQARTAQPWIDMMEEFLGPDYYFVHFNRQPGVADAVLDAHCAQFLRNLFRKNVPLTPPAPGMVMIDLAQADTPLGDPLMSDDDLAVYVDSFTTSGFTGSINWYRNLDRNWGILDGVDPVIHTPALMIYGDRDTIPKSDRLTDFVPNVDVVSLDCGHCIQQEKPAQTNAAILGWLAAQP
ncbi:Pimeloyl-ACP methyl ester carboxylesterase [Yoonia tamlensis]|uniref:Pimeloyl-ACP methyl ester carboxylesterase n=1 Tax=Yoonia tamlensis TaxID=390270 RepID=A0A1I6FY24_9RHOB|nr:alpha/beta hydrolase [Yoonia tamlensis]SFR34838.1 Pimeloyl-ACP methyl ester carboxylesterase [Yoonia tamlensis]